MWNFSTLPIEVLYLKADFDDYEIKAIKTDHIYDWKVSRMKYRSR